MQITNETLTDVQIIDIEKRIATRATKARAWDRYLAGKNPTITDLPTKNDPDNRVPVPFARKIVRTLKGYMFKPGYITYTSEGDYAQTLKEIYDYNDEELLTAEIANEALSKPETYEILRIDGALQPRLYAVAYAKGYPVYDDSLDKNMVAFVHLEQLDDEDDTEVMTVYYANEYIEYRKDGKGEWQGEEPIAHPFGDVPVIVYRAGAEESPIFDAVTPMIDEHDKVISSAYADERERFANSLLVLLDKLVSGDESEQEETLRRMRENRILQDIGRTDAITRVQDAVMYLHKPSRGPDTAEEADRLERLIYDMAMVINPTDESFVAASGIALRYKLLPMEFLAADIEAYFSRGLQHRIELIGEALRVLWRVQPETVTVHWRRNLPVDLETLATTSQTLKGILSDRTILQQFPADVVPDLDAELERIAEMRDPYPMDFVAEVDEE